MDDVGMNLCQGNELEVRRAEGGLEAAAVFEDVFLAVPLCKPHIKNLFAVHWAHAACAGTCRIRMPRTLRSIQSDPDRPEETDTNVCPTEGRLRALRLSLSVFAA